MHKRLEEERKRRFLDSVPELIRVILSDYLSNTNGHVQNVSNQTSASNPDE